MRNEAVLCKHLRGRRHISDTTFVGANGVVAACCSKWTTIGNLHDNLFEDIWNCTPRRKIAPGILNGSLEAVCANCPQIQSVDYAQNEGDFLRSADLDQAIIEAEAKSVGLLPTLQGLNAPLRMA